MHLSKLILKNFKNLSREFEFSPDYNVILAPNGSGKTNTLEAIFFLSNSSSFRVFPESNLISYEEVDFARIEADIDKNKIQSILSKKASGINKKFLYNGAEKSPSEFIKIFDVILFSPNTVDLVAGSPDIRRKDIDDFLSKYDGQYRSKLATYRKVIQNRNKLLSKLKSGRGSLEELDFWNDNLVSNGEYITERRLSLLEEIKEHAKNSAEEIYREDFSGFEIVYKKSYETENLGASIVENLDKEIAMGSSLYGPHRDDMRFSLKNQDLRISGSRGQQRIASLIYKISQWYLLKLKTQKSPILLLDDIMSELDKVHRENIENKIKEGYLGQVILTSCDDKDFTQDFAKKNIITL